MQLGRSDCGGEISEKPMSLWRIEISPHIKVTACPLNKIHLEVVYQPTPFHQMEQAGQQLILLSKWGRKKYCQKSQITTRINSLTKTSRDTLTLTAITSFLSFLYSFTSGKISTLFIFYTCFSLNCEEGVGGRGTGGSKPPTSCISFFIDFPSSAIHWLQSIKQFSVDYLYSSRFLPFKKTHRPLFSLSVLPPPPCPPLNTHLLIKLRKMCEIVDCCWHDKYIGLLYAENFP